MNTLKRLFNPEIFQGVNKNKNYFEGYYFKLVDKEEKHSFAFIPGIAFDKNKSGHSFIQWIDAENYNTEYFRFSEEDFEYSNNRFFVKIKENEFSKDRLKINLKNKDYQISGNLVFSEIVNFDKNLLRPNIMGPFTFVPFIECYHGIVNISHQISGKLVINGKEVDFTGDGYIEKDWGKSFPESYVWMQSNNFEKSKASMMFSLAKIPFLKTHFTGFLSFLKFDEKMYLFSTYTNAKVKKLSYKNGNISVLIEDRKYILSIEGSYDKSGVLKAPKNGMMERKISESITSQLTVTLKSKDGKILFKDIGQRAGLEIVKDEKKSQI